MLYRPNRLAEGTRLRSSRLPSHRIISPLRAIRIGLSAAPSRSFDTGKFRGGFRRRGVGDKLRFYNYAQGSAEECKYYLILSRDLNYADPSKLMVNLEEVIRLLEAYARKLRRTIVQPAIRST